ncbi:MAG: hypothetical protein GWP12_04180, partial [Nitrospirae bacterium]|nr:hypothetical protein [Nitrospirota bacterium]
MLRKLFAGFIVLGFILSQQGSAAEAKKSVKQKSPIVVLQTNQGNIELKL